MGVSLKKGGSVSLAKESPSMTKCFIALGWNTNRYAGGYDFDLDVSAFLLGASGKVKSDKDFIFYNNLVHPSGAVQHTGDELTGSDQADNDDEVINIDLSKIPTDVEKIAFTVTIHEAATRMQNFGQVDNAYARLVDASNNKELLRYNLGDEFSIETSLVVCELERKGSGWDFTAIGEAINGDLSDACAKFGVRAG